MTHILGQEKPPLEALEHFGDISEIATLNWNT